MVGATTYPSNRPYVSEQKGCCRSLNKHAHNAKKVSEVASVRMIPLKDDSAGQKALEGRIRASYQMPLVGKITIGLIGGTLVFLGSGMIELSVFMFTLPFITDLEQHKEKAAIKFVRNYIATHPFATEQDVTRALVDHQRAGYC